MALTSILVCADTEAVQVISGIFQDLGIQVETCGEPVAAQAQIEQQPFDVLVVDCCDEPSAAALIAHARRASLRPSCIVIALVSKRNDVQKLFALGTNFLLYKPISRERALQSFYAARKLIRPERRAKPRTPVQALASIAYPGKEDAAATVLELNESGLGLRTSEKLPPSGKVYFQFTLPGQKSVVRLAGEVMWRDAEGRVGVRFANVPQSSKRLLRLWLEEQSASAADGQSASNTASAIDVNVNLSAGLGLLSVSAPDRRNLSRRACCLGAEVYRADGNVPNRCTLSDISTGGCYVETPEPFPAGTIVTIVVRTHEHKLCLAGKVQSTHRAFGMGVRFNLTTDDERAQVQKLIACAQTRTGLTR
jgi:CheY-like chemotaxis protein/Tfp pilus assembly protein PilZ